MRTLLDGFLQHYEAILTEGLKVTTQQTGSPIYSHVRGQGFMPATLHRRTFHV